jgi:hypothetical protein
MSAGTGKRYRTTLVKNKQELLEGRTVIDITDERLAARRREDYETTLGQLSSIHWREEPKERGGASRLWRRLTGSSKH